MPVMDVVLFERGQVDHPDLFVEPPLRRRVDLAPGLYLGPLDSDLVRLLKDACAPRGHNWTLYVHTLPCPYAFVRENPAGDFWDSDGQLKRVVALSRICRPTSVGLEFSGRIFPPGSRDASRLVIEPGMINGHGSQAFIASPADRDWLSESDIQSLPQLISSYGALPDRLKRALWFHEYAARTEHVPVRWTLAATGIEALTHVERVRSTRQFVVGAQGLASDCTISLSTSDAEAMYSQRSEYAHGASVRSGTPALLVLLEAILRCSLKRAMTDSTYAANFLSDTTVRSKFPL